MQAAHASLQQADDLLSLECAHASRITSILIISTPNDPPQFRRLLRDGRNEDCHLAMPYNLTLVV